MRLNLNVLTFTQNGEQEDQNDHDEICGDGQGGHGNGLQTVESRLGVQPDLSGRQIDRVFIGIFLEFRKKSSFILKNVNKIISCLLIRSVHRRWLFCCSSVDSLFVVRF